jgi:glycine dehydrogenase subunit 1
MGKYGMKRVAELCYHKAHYAADQIDDLEEYSVDRSKSFFNEFIVKCPKSIGEINELLIDEGIVGGYELEQEYPHLANHMLLCVTEMNSREEIDMLVEILGRVN